MAMLRTLLVLGRVSNLPTVWSNCLAGWLLAGGGDWHRFALLSLGATYLYLAGMYLNDAFDAQWDQQRRPERPIPSGAVTVVEVWQWGLIWMALGVGCLAVLGKDTTILALLLAGCIFLYDAIHKIFSFSPVLMAGCRFLLILTAASAADAGVPGLAVWSALVMGCYVFGLSFLAQAETSPANLRYWPCVLMGAPVVLALVVNRGDYQVRGAVLAALAVVWGLRCLRYTYWSPQRNVAHSTAGLLAGIVLVDLLAVAGGPGWAGAVFAGLFFAALLLQRFVPAT